MMGLTIGASPVRRGDTASGTTDMSQGTTPTQGEPQRRLRWQRRFGIDYGLEELRSGSTLVWRLPVRDFNRQEKVRITERYLAGETQASLAREYGVSTRKIQLTIGPRLPPGYQRSSIIPQSCAVEGCTRSPTRSGLCGYHRNRKRKYGDPTYQHTRLQPQRTCSIEVCTRAAAVGGLCNGHYYRQRKCPGVPMELPIRERVDSPGRSCTVEGCDRKPHVSGLCHAHYARQTRIRRQERRGEARL